MSDFCNITAKFAYYVRFSIEKNRGERDGKQPFLND